MRVLFFTFQKPRTPFPKSTYMFLKKAYVVFMKRRSNGTFTKLSYRVSTFAADLVLE